ncbi:unnamed protein product [Schistosoma margrebowiei]|uniref:Uncharacterized protein n=1 Tax=Schistosoma margrebowiei TaxID=48269 RepID=A0A183M6A0_9TREM|nr:unnamed protein product [Schistosoma margrebowiei]
MVVGGSQQETLDPGFVLLGIRQQGVPAILRELVLPGMYESDLNALSERWIVVSSGSQFVVHFILFGIRQPDVPASQS